MHQTAKTAILASLHSGKRLLYGAFAALLGAFILVLAYDAAYPVAPATVGLFCISVALACATRPGRVRQFLGSLIGCAVLVLAAWYLWAEMAVGDAQISDRCRDQFVRKALLYFVLFGLPGAAYVWSARFGFARPKPETQLWFRSTRFPIGSEEDPEGCYGKEFAHWLRDRLVAQGREVDDPIEEDWGWLLELQHKPFCLWIGCTNVYDSELGRPGAPAPSNTDIVWNCFVVADGALFKRLLGRIDIGPAADKLFAEVRSIIENDACNTLVEEP